MHSKVYPSTLADKALFERLPHVHPVQHAFPWISGPRTSQFEPKKIEAFPDPSALKADARQGLAGLDQ